MEYTCPLTLDPPEQPVTTPSCGHTFERAALERLRVLHLQREADEPLRCPVCRSPLANAHEPFLGLAINTAMRNQMDEMRDLRARLEMAERTALAPRAADAPTLDLSDIVVAAGRPIGQGSFGKVRRATMGGALVAVKQTPVDDERAVRDAARELAALQRLRHPHIVELLGWAENEETGELWTVLALAPHGSLAALLGAESSARRLSAFGDATALPGATPTFWAIGHQVACALGFLHRQRPDAAVHGDVKPENVLIFAGGIAKLADFGLSRLAGSMTRAGSTQGGARGSMPFMAPELSDVAQPSAQSDMYALGMLLCMLLSGERPFAQLPSDRAIIKAVDAGQRPALPATTPDQLRALVGRCWAAVPAERPAAMDAMIELIAMADAAAGGGAGPQGSSTQPVAPEGMTRGGAEANRPPEASLPAVAAEARLAAQAEAAEAAEAEARRRAAAEAEAEARHRAAAEAEARRRAAAEAAAEARRRAALEAEAEARRRAALEAEVEARRRAAAEAEAEARRAAAAEAEAEAQRRAAAEAEAEARRAAAAEAEAVAQRRAAAASEAEAEVQRLAGQPASGSVTPLSSLGVGATCALLELLSVKDTSRVARAGITATDLALVSDARLVELGIWGVQRKQALLAALRDMAQHGVPAERMGSIRTRQREKVDSWLAVRGISASATRVNWSQPTEWGREEPYVLGELLAYVQATRLCISRGVFSFDSFGSPPGIQSLTESLEVNTTLTVLDLSCNELNDAAALALGKAFEVNETLTKLDLERNNLGDASKSAIRTAWLSKTGRPESGLEI
jgi:hypothetical protein